MALSPLNWPVNRPEIRVEKAHQEVQILSPRPAAMTVVAVIAFFILPLSLISPLTPS